MRMIDGVDLAAEIACGQAGRNADQQNHDLDDQPTVSEIRAPKMSRMKMSRPSWSVPIGCSQARTAG